ncbi:cupin domain-containing protein [Myxococcus sp. RHSTA-1-4]|uniref:cupin domain-containing protein n=1 Tax=Myxococcus sp. RHSTA-1-4 TaxID=2874601 RepID=UPI001CBD42D8|nr:cupin domain-containing protein [Myxococcus sp. RHSTA-1-4]MBZ4422478.1 cupin domain-containing protein [Myxococcus sp. RHSTA-1-4]
MEQPTHPLAVVAEDAPLNTVRSILPAAFAARVQGREKRRLGALFGLENFGVNLTRIVPGGMSSIRHAHTKQDEFIYVLAGHPTLQTTDGAVQLAPGMCAGFKAGSGRAHHLVNETDTDVLYLEVGDRTPGDEVTYPGEDLKVTQVNGAWVFTHEDGTPY